MKGKIAYRFDLHSKSTVYLNIIPNYNCTNACLFCGNYEVKQTHKPNIYEREMGFLYLPKSPSVKEILKSISSEIKDTDTELAIVGLGEPLIYLPKVAEVVKNVKEIYNIRTRVDTNGLVKYMFDNPAKKLEEAGLDEIRISLNAVNEKEYNILCRPRFRRAFPSLISFIKDCLSSTIDTKVSFMTGFEADGVKHRTDQEYTDFALSLGVKPENIILREYTNPII